MRIPRSFISRDETQAVARDNKLGFFGRRRVLGDITNKTTERSEPTGVKKSSSDRGLFENLRRKTSSTTIASSVDVPQPTRKTIPAGVEDIDYPHRNNPGRFPEYVDDIYADLKKKESRFVAHPDFLSRGRSAGEVSERMRRIVVDWLVDVAERFKMGPESLYLAVNIMDRYCEAQAVTRTKLQLVGITALWIGGKYEEMYIPSVRHFLHMCDKTYTKAELLRMEQNILGALKFNLTLPYPITFLSRCVQAAKCDAKTENYAKYLCELTLCESSTLKYTPSMIAASAMCIAMRSVRGSSWNATLEHYTAFKEADLSNCMRDLVEIARGQSSSSKTTAIRRKYSASKFGYVSSITATR